MSKFLKGIKGPAEKGLTARDADEIAEKLHAPREAKAAEAPAAPPTPPPPAEEEITAEQLHRLTIDLPKDVFEQMRRDTKKRGQTIKGFLVWLIKTHYGLHEAD